MAVVAVSTAAAAADTVNEIQVNRLGGAGVNSWLRFFAISGSERFAQ